MRLGETSEPTFGTTITKFHSLESILFLVPGLQFVGVIGGTGTDEKIPAGSNHWAGYWWKEYFEHMLNVAADLDPRWYIPWVKVQHAVEFYRTRRGQYAWAEYSQVGISEEFEMDSET